MKTSQTATLLGCALLCGCAVGPTQARRDFISQPDDDQRLHAVQALIRPAQDPCASVAGLENADRARLFALVASGNERAFEVSLRIKKCLDGGELEDMLISIGTFVDRKPEAFLVGVSQTEQSNGQLADMVRALPLDLADDFDGMIKLIQRRRESVAAIKRPDMSQLRGRAVDILVAYETELRKTKAELRN